MKKANRKKHDKEIKGRISALETQVHLLHEIILKQAFLPGSGIIGVADIYEPRKTRTNGKGGAC